MKKIFALFILLAAATFTSAANWYVDVISSGLNNGTSWANAWQDFGSINWNNVTAGDTILISGTTDTTRYNDTLKIQKSGASNNFITIKIGSEAGHNGYAVVRHGIRMEYYRNYITINGKGKKLIVEQNNTAGIFINLCTNITIKNVEVRGVGSVPYQHGIMVIYKSHYIAIDSCYIHGTTGDGINISVADADSLIDNYDLFWHGDYIVSNCRIDSCADDGLQLTAARATIKNNVFRYVDVAHGGINPQGGHPDGIQTAVEGWHMTIDGNTFINCMQAAFIEKSRGYLLVVNNIMYDINSELTAGNTNRFVATNEAPSGAIGPTIFANNVLFSSDWAALYFPVSHFDSPTELIIRNNIFVNCKRWVLTDSTEMSYIRGDNIFYTSNDAFCQPGCPAYPDSGIHENPWFTNYGNHDFTLQERSPARGTGTNLSQYFTTDFNGNPRPATGAWDIGAFQYSGSAIAAPATRKTNRLEASKTLAWYTVTGKKAGAVQTLPNGIYLAQEYVNGPLRKVMVAQ